MKALLLTGLTVTLAVIPLTSINCKAQGGKPIPVDNSVVLCPICGMKVNTGDTHWRSIIILKDRSRVQFDTPKHAFLYYLNIHDYSTGKYQPTDVDSFFVHDYFTQDLVSAFTESFLAGSDIRSIMGLDLIPMPEDSIRKLIPAHQGRKVNFNEIDKKLVAELQKGTPIKTTTQTTVEPTTAVCPVGDMKVDISQAKSQGLVAQYQGKTYYFCSASDRDAFKKNPALYVK